MNHDREPGGSRQIVAWVAGIVGFGLVAGLIVFGFWFAFAAPVTTTTTGPVTTTTTDPPDTTSLPEAWCIGWVSGISSVLTRLQTDYPEQAAEIPFIRAPYKTEFYQLVGRCLLNNYWSIPVDAWYVPDPSGGGQPSLPR